MLVDEKYVAADLKVPIPEPTSDMKDHGFTKVDYVTVEVFRKAA